MVDNCKNLLPILYTTTEPTSSEPKRCVVVMDRLRAVTFRHGGHLRFTQDQVTKIYPIDPSAEPIDVKVIAISDTADLIVFHTINKDFDVYPDAVGDTDLGQSYKLIGIDAKGRPNVKGGVISKKRVGFAIGDNHAEDGDSGAAIVDLRNCFIGMAIGRQDFIAPPNTVNGSMLNLAP
ncbi:hypothetical protein FO519_010384, partial [Halicephalobus sp. NKZ332]